MMRFTVMELDNAARGIAVVWPKNQVTLISRGQNTWLFRGWGTAVFDESSLDGGRFGAPGGPPGTIEVYDADLQQTPFRQDNPVWLRVAAPQRRDTLGLTRYDIEMPGELYCIVLPRWAYDILATGPTAADKMYRNAKHCVDLLGGWDGRTPAISAIKTVIEQIASAQTESLDLLSVVRDFQQLQEAKLQRLQREAPLSEAGP